MGIRQYLANLLYKAPAAGVNVSEYRANRPYHPPDKLKDLVTRYTGWVYAFVHLNAVNCAQVPLRVYYAKDSAKTKIKAPHRRLSVERKRFLAQSPSTQQYLRKAEDVEEITDHPFLDLMNNVNPWTNQFDLLETLFMFLDLCGNEFWLLNNGTMGIPTEIWPLFPQFMAIVPDKQKFISGYEYKISNVVQKFEPKEIVHFKNPSPVNPFWGLGPLRAAILAADLSAGYDQHEATLMKNGARPDMALVFPEETQGPDKDEMKSIYGRWKRRHGGKNQGGLAIVTGGAELKQLSLSQREMEFIQGRKMTREELGAVFGVPLSKVTTENVNLANAKVGEKQYAADTILPRLRKVEQKMNEQIVPVYQQPGLFVAFDNPVPDDHEFALKEREVNIKTGFAPINEERAKVGLDPVAWGDEPQNLSTGDDANVTDANATTGGGGKTKRRKKTHKLSPLQMPTDSVNKAFVDTIADWLEGLKQRAIDNLDTSGETLVKSPLDDWMSGWIDEVRATNDLSTRMAPFLRTTLATAGNAAVTSVTTERDFNELNPQVTRRLSNHRTAAIKNIEKTQAKKLRLALSQGIAEGEGIPKLRNRILAAYSEEKTRYEATRIARTETIWAWNEGAVQGYIQSGVVTKKEWLSSDDERTCQFCPEMDGKVVSVEVEFFNKGETFRGTEGGLLNFDYEGIGHPPLHPQCRCTIIPVVEDF